MSDILKNIKVWALWMSGISLLSPNFAHALLVSLAGWRNPASGQVVFLGGDEHTLGSLSDNLQEFEKIKESVFLLFEEKRIPLQLLVENPFFYGQNLRTLSEKEVSEMFPSQGRVRYTYRCPFNGTKKIENQWGMPKDPFTTWMLSPMPALFSLSSEFIQFQSIDPRLPHIFWVNEASLRRHASAKSVIGLESIAAPSMRRFISDRPNSVLTRLIQRHWTLFDEGKEAFMRTLHRYLGQREVDSRVYTAQELIDRGWLSVSDLRRLAREIDEQSGPGLDALLELEAIWEITQARNFKAVFLFMGEDHIPKVEVALQQLGYSPLFRSRAEDGLAEGVFFRLKQECQRCIH